MNFTIKFLALICVVFLFSCSGDTPSAETNVVKDDFSYLSVNTSGKIEKTGNNTGKLSPFSKFEGLTNGTILGLNTIACNSDKIYLIEHIPPTDKLFVFDRNTKTTISKKLLYPKEIIGDEPTMTSLVWDESNKMLYGIVVNNPNSSSPNNLCYFIKINPNTLEISYEGLTFKQTASYTTFFNAGKLYSSYHNDNTIEINLSNNTSKAVLFNNSKISFMRATSYSNNTAYCLINKINGGVALAKINLSDYSYEDLLPNETLGIFNPTGKGYIDPSTNEYVCYMIKDAQYCLLKYNISTKIFSAIKYTLDSSINNNILIIDKVAN
ncbi:hypothetical protein [Flavobacterium cellulosilyticum]|uniref:Lipoprotein n=1 Tax=Flavobacterium cellulosilyticum TaxID=2541731 RepID=A0A4R5CDP6_9FLAO|nr:hypothetical protein [Flavobacterium cellulosilyticum]TDD97059.1 hypothetical protein E0F76_10500 [Flavobacterium cellulosilyticum]